MKLNKKYFFGTLVAVLLIIIVVIAIGQKQPTGEAANYAGAISTRTDGQQVYTNARYGFQFAYPKGWLVGDNSLGYSTLQLSNYDISKADGKDFNNENGGRNKIEAYISDDDADKPSEFYPETNRKEKQVVVTGQSSIYREIELIGNDKVNSYTITLPNTDNKYLRISIYGDQANFSILDKVVGSIVWLK